MHAMRYAPLALFAACTAVQKTEAVQEYDTASAVTEAGLLVRIGGVDIRIRPCEQRYNMEVLFYGWRLRGEARLVRHIAPPRLMSELEIRLETIGREERRWFELAARMAEVDTDVEDVRIKTHLDFYGGGSIVSYHEQTELGSWHGPRKYSNFLHSWEDGFTERQHGSFHDGKHVLTSLGVRFGSEYRVLPWLHGALIFEAIAHDPTHFTGVHIYRPETNHALDIVVEPNAGRYQMSWGPFGGTVMEVQRLPSTTVISDDRSMIFVDEHGVVAMTLILRGTQEDPKVAIGVERTAVIE